jgi:hypothetical protein
MRATQDEDEEQKPDRSDHAIKARAKAFGYSMQRDLDANVDGVVEENDDRTAFVFTHVVTGDQPLGPDPVPAADIDKFLDDVADDLGDDVDEIDVNAHLKKPRPSPEAKKKAAAAKKEAAALLKANKPKRAEPAVDPLTAERIRDRNAMVLQDRWLRRTNQSTALHDPESGEDDALGGYDPADDVPLTGKFLPPEAGEYDPAPKAAAGFAVAAKTGRMSSAELAKRKQFLAVTADIKAALSAKPRDGARIGQLLTQAKGLVAHGGFEKFVSADLDLPTKTAQNYLAAAKSAHQ